MMSSQQDGNTQHGQDQYQQNSVPPLRNSGKKPGTVKRLAGIFALSPKSREVAVQEYNQSDSSRNLAMGSRREPNQNFSTPNHYSQNSNAIRSQQQSFVRNTSYASTNNSESVYSEGNFSVTNSNGVSGYYSNSTKPIDNRLHGNAPMIVQQRNAPTQEMLMQQNMANIQEEESKGAFECSLENITNAICGDPNDVSFNQTTMERDDATTATGISDNGMGRNHCEFREEIPYSPSNNSMGSNRSNRRSPLKFFGIGRNMMNEAEVMKGEHKKQLDYTEREYHRPNLHVDTSRSPYGMDDAPITDASRMEFSENQEYAMVAGLSFNPRSGGDIQSGITPRYRRNAFDNFYDLNNQYAYAAEGRLGVIPQRSNLTSLEVQNMDPNDPINVERENEIRNFADSLSPRWAQSDLMVPTVARRIRDFQFAREKRRQRYGKERPIGILGLYDYLAGIRIDVEWAEDAAWRRVYGRPYLSWADFENMKNSGFGQPFFTYFLVLMSSLMLIASIGTNNWAVESLTTNPMIGPSVETLLKLGAKDSNLIVNEGEGWRLIAPMVLHAGFIHYAVNMLALWFIGSAVERIHGSTAAAIIFMISAIGGTIMSAVFLPEYVTVGASGGIFGLVGACLADISMNWNILFSKYLNEEEATNLHHGRVLAWLTFDVFINCIIGLTPFVDNFTHMGGMIIGFLCGLSTMERLDREFFGYERSCVTKARHVATRLFGLLLSIMLICVFSAILLEGDGVTSPCPNCRYASCVPFPPWAPEENKWWYCDDCDRVKGSAQRNTQTGYYEQIQLECPDGQNIAVTLVEDAVTTSKALLEADLPYYCRDYCENVYAK